MLVWLAFDDTEPLAHDRDLGRLAALPCIGAQLLGVAFAGLTRGAHRLYRVGASDE